MAKIKKVRKYQNSGPALRAKSDNTSVARRNPATEDRMRARKAQDKKDVEKVRGKYTVIAKPDPEAMFPGDSIRYYPGQRGGVGVPYIRDVGGKGGGLIGIDTKSSDLDFAKASRDKKRTRTYQDTTAVRANKDYMGNQKNGGKTKKSGGKLTKAKNGTMVPKKTSVSKKVGSAKKSIGTRSMKRK
jgi:hypothetical protein